MKITEAVKADMRAWWATATEAAALWNELLDAGYRPNDGVAPELAAVAAAYRAKKDAEDTLARSLCSRLGIRSDEYNGGRGRSKVAKLGYVVSTLRSRGSL